MQNQHTTAQRQHAYLPCREAEGLSYRIGILATRSRPFCSVLMKNELMTVNESKRRGDELSLEK